MTFDTVAVRATTAEWRTPGGSRVTYARQGAHALADLIGEERDLRVSVLAAVRWQRKRNRDDGHAFRLESELESQQAVHALEREAGADEEHERERQLRDDERAVDATHRTLRATLPAATEIRRQAAMPARVQRRYEAEEEAGGDSDA